MQISKDLNLSITSLTILLISLSNKEYEKYDTVKASINSLNIMKNI